MSDGPYKSLPMRPGWQRVAKYGDISASAPEEINDALVGALQGDCRSDLRPGLIDGIVNAFKDQELSLFKDQLVPQLEVLREVAGSGLGRTILDYVVETVERGRNSNDDLEDAVANALTDRATKGSRQVEEHYCRESSAPRARKVRARIDGAIQNASIKGLARDLLKQDISRTSARSSFKQSGLDDGVRL